MTEMDLAYPVCGFVRRWAGWFYRRRRRLHHDAIAHSAFRRAPALGRGHRSLVRRHHQGYGRQVHAGKGNVEWRIVGFLALGSVPGTLATIVLLAYLPARSPALTHAVTLAIGVALLLAAAGSCLDNWPDASPPGSQLPCRALLACRSGANRGSRPGARRSRFADFGGRRRGWHCRFAPLVSTAPCGPARRLRYRARGAFDAAGGQRPLADGRCKLDAARIAADGLHPRHLAGQPLGAPGSGSDFAAGARRGSFDRGRSDHRVVSAARAAQVQSPVFHEGCASGGRA